MGRPRRLTCRYCDRNVDECGPLTARGNCIECGIARMDENYRALTHYEGEAHKRYRAKMILAQGGILPDDLKGYGES